MVEKVCMAVMYIADRHVSVLLDVPKIARNGRAYESGDIIRNRRHVSKPYEDAVILGVGETLDAAKAAGQEYYNQVALIHRKEDGATQFWEEESENWESIIVWPSCE